MTTVEVAFTPDTTVDNDVCNLDVALLAERARPAAVAWIQPRPATDRSAALLERVVTALDHRSSFDGHGEASGVWLLAGDAAWQTESRVTRHGGFWGRLRRGGTVLDGLADLAEADLRREGAFKAFGAARVSQATAEAIDSVIRATGNAYLMTASGSIEGIEKALQTGWTRGAWFDYELLNHVLGVRELLCRPVGEFDDPQVGFVCVGD